MMTKQQAIKSGRALQKRMRGGPWKLRVWENVGWHYAVETERLSVHGPSYGGVQFSCLLKPHYSIFGAGGSSVDPNRAVKKTLRTAIDNINSLELILAEASNDAWL